MITDSVWRLLTGVLIVAIIYMCVRPGSKAATAVTDISGALRKLVTAATRVSPAARNTKGQPPMTGIILTAASAVAVRVAIPAAAAAAIVLPLAATQPAAAAPVQHAHVTAAVALAAAPPCPAGFSPITNQAGGSIAGNGVNNPVILASTGNCFKPENPFNYSGATGYEYVNGDGHCLWTNGAILEVGANDCIACHVNEQIVGVQHTTQGWGLLSVAEGEYLQPNICGENGSIVTAQPSVGSCPRWPVT